uniref:Leukocyte cell-derived chemotaxin 1 n=1 Tax=Denticeps clupeoides TaxID=299321 RepID=A0AAY4DJI7_9TELE
MQTMLAERMGSFLQVHNFHYSTDVDGRVEEGSMEWWRSTTFKLGVFSTGAGNAEYHTVIVLINEILQGITGIYFSGGGKCYIRSQIKAFHPGKDGILPVKSDDKSLIWVAAEEPLKDRSFLSSKILGLCGDRPIFWLHPTERFCSNTCLRNSETHTLLCVHATIAIPTLGFTPAISLGRRKRRDARRSKRQYESGAHTPAPEDTSSPAVKNTHCRRGICEPLGGYWPWPYNYRGCRSACRIILPCRWWVARIMGIV